MELDIIRINEKIYEIFYLICFLVLIYLIDVYLNKKLEKNKYKYGQFIIVNKCKNFFYVFKKKNGKFYFKIIGCVFVGLKYDEIEEPCQEMKVELLNIKLKEKIIKFLNENKNLSVLNN